MRERWGPRALPPARTKASGPISGTSGARFFAQDLRLNELPSSEDRALLATPAAGARASRCACVRAHSLPEPTEKTGRDSR